MNTCWKTICASRVKVKMADSAAGAGGVGPLSPAEIAEKLFLAPVSLDASVLGTRKVNCAEAILRAYLGDRSALPAGVKNFRALGWGHAPEGECGAYFAAGYVIDQLTFAGPAAGRTRASKRRAFESEFIRRIGSKTCTCIKKDRLASCRQCVAVGVDLLDRVLGNRPLELAQQ